ARARGPGARGDRRRQAGRRGPRSVGAPDRQGPGGGPGRGATRLAPWASACAALRSWLVGLWLSRRISGPIQALARASNEIASGNYTVHVPVGRGGSEVSHLSERFNQMAARLAATEERERQFLMSVSHEL